MSTANDCQIHLMMVENRRLLKAPRDLELVQLNNAVLDASRLALGVTHVGTTPFEAGM